MPEEAAKLPCINKIYKNLAMQATKNAGMGLWQVDLETEDIIVVGMDDYLSKPLSVDKLRKALSTWLENDAPEQKVG